MFSLISTILLITDTTIQVDVAALLAGAATLVTAVGGVIGLWWTNRNRITQSTVSTETKLEESVEVLKKTLREEMGAVHRRFTSQDEAAAAHRLQTIQLAKAVKSNGADIETMFALLSEVDTKVTKSANSRSRKKTIEDEVPDLVTI
jgi:nitrate reductase gamma subunit